MYVYIYVYAYTYIYVFIDDDTELKSLPWSSDVSSQKPQPKWRLVYIYAYSCVSARVFASVKFALRASVVC